jgi:hypothetical protein
MERYWEYLLHGGYALYDCLLGALIIEGLDDTPHKALSSVAASFALSDGFQQTGA